MCLFPEGEMTAPPSEAIRPTTAYTMLALFRYEGEHREELLAAVAAADDPVLALWALQDIPNLGSFRNQFFETIITHGDSSRADRALQSVADCGPFREALINVARRAT